MYLSVSNMTGRAGGNVDSGKERDLTYSTCKDTFRLHIKQSGITQQIINVFIQQGLGV